MILTCPTCVTSYHVDGAAFPLDGRTVRCASCAHSWKALRSDLEDEAMELSPKGVPAFATTPGAMASAGAIDATTPALLPKLLRAKAKAERDTRKAMATGVVWAMLGAVFVVILAGAALFRVQVVRLIPATAGAYAAVHMPVNPVGLSLEQVQGAPGLQDGRAVLIVTGAQRNIETGARLPSAVKVSLFDKAGHAVASQVVQAQGAAIAPGDTRPFRAVFENPPIASAEFSVDFAFEAPQPQRSRPRAPAAHEARLPPAAAPVGPVKEVTPLAAASPYALAEHPAPPPSEAAHGGEPAKHGE